MVKIGLQFFAVDNIARTLAAKKGGGEGGTNDYKELDNKPKINGITLVGDKTGKALNLVSKVEEDLITENKEVVKAINELAEEHKEFLKVDGSNDMEAPISFKDKVALEDEKTSIEDRNGVITISHTSSTGRAINEPDLVDYELQKVDNQNVLDTEKQTIVGAINEVLTPMVGATATKDGKKGMVPAPKADEKDKFLKGDGTWATISSEPMEGASATEDGEMGAVPQPKAGDQDKFLKGNGEWTALEVFDKDEDGLVPGPTALDDDTFLSTTGWREVSTMVGAGDEDGKKGLVPQPKVADKDKFLKGSGEWATISTEPMKGATATEDGEMGAVPQPLIADKDKFLKGNGEWSEVEVEPFKGATAFADGEQGAVPAPKKADREKVLKGDGTWSEIPVMKGASSSLSGASGLVPEPSASKEDYDAYLKGDGTWHNPDDTYLRKDGANYAERITVKPAGKEGELIINNAGEGDTYAVMSIGAKAGDKETTLQLGSYNTGAKVRLDDYHRGGGFEISANDGENSAKLVGSADGTLTWNGQALAGGVVDVVDNGGTSVVDDDGIAHLPPSGGGEGDGLGPWELIIRIHEELVGKSSLDTLVEFESDFRELLVDVSGVTQSESIKEYRSGQGCYYPYAYLFASNDGGYYSRLPVYVQSVTQSSGSATGHAITHYTYNDLKAFGCHYYEELSTGGIRNWYIGNKCCSNVQYTGRPLILSDKGFNSIRLDFGKGGSYGSFSANPPTIEIWGRRKI